MNNGFTPKQYASSLAITALRQAFHNRSGELDDLTPSERVATRDQIRKLVETLALQANLDIAYPSVTDEA